MNLAGSELLGSEKARLIGTQFTSSISPDSQDAFYFHYREVLKTGIKGNCELKMLKVDGTPFHAQLISMAVPEKDGNINHCRTAVIDITERKQAEEALRVSEERFRSLLENAPIGIAVSTPEGRRIEANKTLMQMQGFGSREEMLAAPVVDIYYDPEDRKHLKALLEKGPAQNFEMRQKRKDGSVFWASLSSITYTNTAGEKQLINVIQDITERKRAEEALSFIADCRQVFLDINRERPLEEQFGEADNGRQRIVDFMGDPRRQRLKGSRKSGKRVKVFLQ